MTGRPIEDLADKALTVSELARPFPWAAFLILCHAIGATAHYDITTAARVPQRNDERTNKQTASSIVYNINNPEIRQPLRVYREP
jgi:hypothetical protein